MRLERYVTAGRGVAQEPGSVRRAHHRRGVATGALILVNPASSVSSP